MRAALLTIFLGLIFSAARSQNCDIATTGVAIVNATNTAPASGGCIGQVFNFKFSIANLGTSTSCAIPANSVTAIFDFPTLAGGIQPFVYNGPASFNSGYFTWTYDGVENVLVGTNISPIPNGLGDADVLVPVIGNAPGGTGASSLNLTQGGATSDNTGNNASSAQLVIYTMPSNQPDQAMCNTSVFTMTQTSPPIGSTGGWTLVAGAATITSPASPTTTVTGVAPGTSATVRWTVTNGVCSEFDEVTVTNNELPVVSCPANMTVCPGSASFALTGAAPAGGTYSGAGVSSNTFDPVAAGLGTHVITYTYSDGTCSNTCNFTITVQDIVSPSISCPSAQTIILDASCSGTLPDYTTLVSASDNCGLVTVTQSPLAGSPVSGTGITVVTLTATDASGNSSSCNFNVNKIDQVPPSITCPATQTLVLDGSCSAVLGDYTTLATTSDNCLGTVTVTQFPLPGTPVSGVGTTVVTLTATDASGNTSGCSFNVNTLDETAPSISCPAAQTLTLDASCSGALGDYTALALVSDNCSGLVTVTQSPLPGTLVSGVGVTSILLTATDPYGNTASCTFDVNRVDLIPPSISCPSTQTIVLDATCNAALGDYTVLAATSDNCSGVITLTQSPVPGTPVSGVGTTVVTLTATDASGNISTCTFNVDRVDLTAPVITCPADQTLILDAGCNATLADYTSLATAADNCSAVVSITQSPVEGTPVSGVGATIVTLTATDASGNTSGCTFNVNRVDQTPPTITCPPSQTLTLDASCSAILGDYTSLAITSDNCSGVITVTQSPAVGSAVSGVGTTQVTLTATDANGNTSSCVFDVNRVDNVPPTILCPGDQAIVLDASCSAALPDYTALATAGDNCSGTVTVTQLPAPGTIVSGVGVVVVTLTATDASGNTSNCVFNVNSVDNTAPVFTCVSPIINVSPNSGSCLYTTTITDPTVTDNCGTISSFTWTVSGPGAVAPFSGSGPMGSHGFGVGMTNVTYVAVDASGNSASCFFTVSVVNNLSGNISGTTTVVQNLGSSNIIFSGASGTTPYTFNYTVNGGPVQTVTTAGSNSFVSVSHTNAFLGQFIYKIVGVTDANGCAGALPVDDQDTITVVSSIPRPDLVSAVTSPLNSQFINGQEKQGYITITNVSPDPTTGVVTFRVSLVANFNLEILGTTTSVTPPGELVTAVDNTNWNISAGPLFYTITSKTTPSPTVINGTSAIRIGYKLKATGSANSGGLMTVTILNGTGGSTPSNGDSNDTNNQSVKLFTIN